MRSIEFKVLGKPITQGSKTGQIVGQRIKVRGVTAVLLPRVKLLEQTDMATKTLGAHRLTKWRDAVADAAKLAMSGAVCVDLEFVLTRPESHYTKVSKRLRSGAPPNHITKPDRGKLGRAVEDAMSGIVYGDDSQITAGETTKRYAARGGYPGVVIKVRRLI